MSPYSEENPATDGGPSEKVETAEAGASDAPTFTLEDVEHAQTLLTEGKRNFMCGSVAEAAKSLSKACEILGGYYGDTSKESGEAFLYYGRTLLELARKEPDVIAHAVEGIPLEDAEEAAADDQMNEGDKEEKDEDNENLEEVRQQVLDALDENAELLESGQLPAEEETADACPEEVAEPESAVEEQEEPIVEEPADEGTSTDDEAAQDQEGSPEISNLQLAWETLDVARLIFEKNDDEISRERLAECHLALGETAIEDGEYETAIRELTTCTELQKQIYEKDDRRIAVSYFNTGLAYSLDEKYDEAISYFNMAIDVMKTRKVNLESKFNDLTATAVVAQSVDSKETQALREEIDELAELIMDVENRVQDCVDSKPEVEASKKALQELEKQKALSKEANGSANGESSVNDITHLVRKPVKRDSDGEDRTADAKRAKMATENNGCEAMDTKTEANGNGATA